MTNIYYLLEDFTKPNENAQSRHYGHCAHCVNMAHIVSDFCKAHGIDFQDCGMTIFQTRTRWETHRREWVSIVDWKNARA